MSATIHIVGGGLVGTLAAIFLARRNYNVELYERRGDMRKGPVDAGRSINLVVTPRGLVALDRVGLKEKVLEIAIPLEGRMLHDAKGQTTYVPYGHKPGEVINAVSRGLLNVLLLKAAGEYKNINIHFRRKCTGYDVAAKTISFLNEETGKEEKVAAGVTIGADGAFSAIRHVMLDKVINFNYAQDFLPYGYKELVIPPDGKGAHRMKNGVFHIWPRGDYMLIGIPNIDGSFTCTLFLRRQGEYGFDSLKTAADLANFFKKIFPDAVPLMPTLEQDFFKNPTGSLVTVKCAPWHIGGQAMLLGDAAHAIVPFYGQGMNTGFEDCTALGEILDSGEKDWQTIFEKLDAARKPNTDAIADMAVENFREMRDTTADPKFQLKKQVGFALEDRHPGRFIPRYSMVMFHPEIPFAEARRRADAQERLLDDLCANINTLEQVDWKKADDLVRRVCA
ncbi:MAG TPA: NAD(P)/FAD-dependent oxidoreductase [Patescibacteria group bacterium]|nr:NAD(P)/FAD-dependent oxidoreductase [Patescibacteria group bacterium]